MTGTGSFLLVTCYFSRGRALVIVIDYYLRPSKKVSDLCNLSVLFIWVAHSRMRTFAQTALR
jgi:hypothetical protein